MMKKYSIIVLICLCFFSGATLAQAPDLDKIVSTIKVAAPPVESLDQAAIQLHYFDSVPPTQEQEVKLLEAFKALSNGFAANVHYKQGYTVFQKYLSLKEKILVRQKTEVITKLETEYQQKDKSDEDKAVSLQSAVQQLNLDTEGYISKRSGFKNAFSIIIVILSMLFAASLFRSGVRLKNLRNETKTNQNKLEENHRIATLGYLEEGIRSAFELNETKIKKAAEDGLKAGAKQGSETLLSLSKVLNEIKQKAR